MRIAPDWKDYSVIATGDGDKLERWGKYVLLRPDPQVIWRAAKPLRSYEGIDADLLLLAIDEARDAFERLVEYDGA